MPLEILSVGTSVAFGPKKEVKIVVSKGILGVMLEDELKNVVTMEPNKDMLSGELGVALGVITMESEIVFCDEILVDKPGVDSLPEPDDKHSVDPLPEPDPHKISAVHI